MPHSLGGWHFASAADMGTNLLDLHSAAEPLLLKAYLCQIDLHVDVGADHSPWMHKDYSSKWRSTGPHACCCAEHSATARTAQSGGTSARTLPRTSITSHTSATIDTASHSCTTCATCAYSAQSCLAMLRLSHTDPSCTQDALFRALVGSRRQLETDNQGAELSSSMC